MSGEKSCWDDRGRLMRIVYVGGRTSGVGEGEVGEDIHVLI